LVWLPLLDLYATHLRTELSLAADRDRSTGSAEGEGFYPIAPKLLLIASGYQHLQPRCQVHGTLFGSRTPAIPPDLGNIACTHG
jgi:hypothetical protein